MTLSAWLYRARGKDAHWSRGGQNAAGEWTTAAMLMIGHAEQACLFPRWMILAECNFWDGPAGLAWRSRLAGPAPRFAD